MRNLLSIVFVLLLTGCNAFVDIQEEHPQELAGSDMEEMDTNSGETFEPSNPDIEDCRQETAEDGIEVEYIEDRCISGDSALDDCTFQYRRCLGFEPDAMTCDEARSALSEAYAEFPDLEPARRIEICVVYGPQLERNLDAETCSLLEAVCDF